MRISVHDLTKRFGPLAVVDGVGFSIEEGELFTLLGPSAGDRACSFKYRPIWRR